MDINTDNEKLIENWIRDHLECKLEDSEPVYIKDKREHLDVYRLPFDLLFYNIRNGRFAAEFRELVQKEGRQINAENAEDAKKIQSLLLKQEPKQREILEEDLLRYGQKDYGIMTWDGYVINGNRRMAILQKIKDSGKDEFGYLNVARLSKGVGEIDLWKIEAGLQLSRQERLDYGPINTLLKLKEGKDTGLTEKQIAYSLYGGFTEDGIKYNLRRLELIEQYLEFIGKPRMYSKVIVHEHFIVLQKILDKQKANGVSPEDQLKIQKIAFELIRVGISQMNLRAINKMMGKKKAKEKLLSANEHIPTINDQTDNEEDENATEDDDGEDEDKDKSPVMSIFEDALDIYEAERDKDKPLELLTRAITNLEEIEPENPILKGESAKEKIKKVIEIVERLKRVLG